MKDNEINKAFESPLQRDVRKFTESVRDLGRVTKLAFKEDVLRIRNSIMSFKNKWLVTSAKLPEDKLVLRYNTNNKDILVMLAHIDEELISARKKFPANYHTMTALTKEVGELAQALIANNRGECAQIEVYKEAIQVAVMAIRLAVDGDSDFMYMHNPYYIETEMSKAFRNE